MLNSLPMHHISSTLEMVELSTENLKISELDLSPQCFQILTCLVWTLKVLEREDIRDKKSG